MKQSKNVKIVVFVPVTHSDSVRLAIGDAGGGHIGNYSHCVFVTPGVGYFLPLNGAKPHLGKIGKIEKVKEVKIEFICPKSKASKIIQAIKIAHPYEEVALDILPTMES